MEKSCLVTGAGSGIGRSVALALHDAGYSVALAGRREDSLAETASMASSSGPQVLAIPTDVCDASQLQALFDTVERQFGRLDLLFNNAGVGSPPLPLEELPLAEWQRAVDTNLTATFLCTQGAMKIMKRQQPMGGRIINNGSISAHSPRPFSVAYTATKHAVTGLTKSTSLDGRSYNIACGQIDIGNASTPMTAKMQQGVPQADGSLAVEPTFDVAHVAQAVVYMASLPLDANVQFMTLMATQMPYIARG